MPLKKANTGLLERPRKICIVENDQKIFDQVACVFLNADYSVTPAKKGTTAIEKMMKDVPDVALVQLGLPDIAGDIVIFRLSQMARTKDVKFVLYTSRDMKHEKPVMERIRVKTGIFTFVEYDKIEDLLGQVNELFKEK